MRFTLRSRLVLSCAAAVAGVAASFTACTDAYRPAAIAMGGASTTTSTSHGGGGGVTLSEAGNCPATCSNDLQNVVDCNGTVLVACTADQGCANGACINDPCTAAQESKSSYGCDYWALKTVQRPQADGACFVAFVANTWQKPVHLTVSRAGKPLTPVSGFAILGSNLNPPYTPYDDVGGLPVGQVALVFLSRLVGGSLVNCPVTAAVGDETGIPIDITGDTGNGVGQAFHIQSDYPVVAYQMTPYGGGQAAVTSATLLLPTSAWDTNYLAIGPTGTAQPIKPGGNPSLDIVAYMDNTVVTLLPTVDIVGNADGGVPGPAPAGTPVMYTLNTGEFLQITQPADLTGTPISATNPVGVFGAHACMEVPYSQADCDSAQQQIPPVKALGSQYVGVRYRGRGGGQNESVPWRLVGAVMGTTLTWQPSQPPGAPLMLDQGTIAEFSAPGPFVVASQDAAHPFYLGAYMTGGGAIPDGGPGFGGEGDPDWVNVITPAQYLNHYVLFTDQTYPETNLVLVRSPSKLDGGFSDVTLDCAGDAGPQVLTGWQGIGGFEYTRVDLSTGNFMPVAGCTNGRQELTSPLPFGVTVWGWGNTQQTQYVSYAYPAGAGFQPINMVVVPTTK